MVEYIYYIYSVVNDHDQPSNFTDINWLISYCRKAISAHIIADDVDSGSALPGPDANLPILPTEQLNDTTEHPIIVNSRKSFYNNFHCNNILNHLNINDKTTTNSRNYALI